MEGVERERERDRGKETIKKCLCHNSKGGPSNQFFSFKRFCLSVNKMHHYDYTKILQPCACDESLASDSCRVILCGAACHQQNADWIPKSTRLKPYQNQSSPVRRDMETHACKLKLESKRMRHHSMSWYSKH